MSDFTEVPGDCLHAKGVVGFKAYVFADVVHINSSTRNEITGNSQNPKSETIRFKLLTWHLKPKDLPFHFNLIEHEGY